YYTGTEPPTERHGTAGDLQRAIIKDGAGNVLDTKYYRYYLTLTATGFPGGLQFAFSPASYARLVASQLPGTNIDRLDDDVVRPYADYYFEYDGLGNQGLSMTYPVTKAVVQGAGCSACTAGQGTFSFTYATNPNLPQNPGYN